MQQVKETTSSTMQDSEQVPLMAKKVKDLMVGKRRLTEVPYTATLSNTMNTLVANQVVALPVAAPPGQWIGAGGSMIMETDKQTGTVRKHYIGMVTILDILVHIAGGEDDQINGGDLGDDLDQRMSVPVSSIIGHCLEGLSLWTLNPNTSLLDCMEVFSKGIHRAMVPLDGALHMENSSGAEVMESAVSYRMLTQMDVIIFLRNHAFEMEDTVTRSVEELGAVSESVYAITERTTVNEAIRCMKSAMLTAVPIVQVEEEEDHSDQSSHLIHGKNRKLVGTFSATDLRGCQLASLRSWLPLSAFEFTQVSPSPRGQVTCHMESSLSEVMDKAIDNHVHRVWVVDRQDLLVGIVSLTDMIRVIRLRLVSDRM